MTETARELLAVRLARIMGSLGPVAKKGKITSQGSGPTYNFARDGDVLEAVIPAMAEAGIIMVPEHMELLSIGLNMRETQLIANIRTDWHVTDGVESVRFQTFGQGQDSGDKALPKAQTNSRKYALFMLYHIVTGDDPDMHASEDRPRAAARRVASVTPGPSLDQIKARLLERANEHHIDSATLDELIRERIGGGTADEVRAGLIALGTDIAAGRYDAEVAILASEATTPQAASGAPTDGLPALPEQMAADEALAAGLALVPKA